MYPLLWDILYRIVSLPAITVTVLVLATLSWANSPEDQALWRASGCFDGSINIGAMKTAIKLGANPNIPSATRLPITPLECVAMAAKTDPAKQAVEAAQILFASGARLGAADTGILYLPIAAGDIELVRLLVERGASPVTEVEGLTPPEIARRYNQDAIYEFLISRGGVPVDAASTAQLEFVHAAGMAYLSSMDQAVLMERALEHGAKIDGKDSSGHTALIAAVSNGASDTIGWLLDRGANPNILGESGFRDLEGVPLHIFVSMTSNELAGMPDTPEFQLAERTLAQLLKAGAKVSGMDSQLRTPLHWAAKSDNVRAAEILIQAGARVMARDVNGRTPLDYAESVAMINLLKDSGAVER